MDQAKKKKQNKKFYFRFSFQLDASCTVPSINANVKIEMVFL